MPVYLPNFTTFTSLLRDSAPIVDRSTTSFLSYIGSVSIAPNIIILRILVSSCFLFLAAWKNVKNRGILWFFSSYFTVIEVSSGEYGYEWTERMVNKIEERHPLEPIHQTGVQGYKFSKEITRVSWWEQFTTLFRRKMKQCFRDKVRKLMRAFIHLFIYSFIHYFFVVNYFC